MKHGSIVRMTSLLVAAAFVGLVQAAQPVVPESLDLNTALRLALENNYGIRQARERIRQQEGVVIEVGALQIPKVSATAAYSRNDKEISTYYPADDRSWSISLQARQTLYAGGGISSSIQSTKLVREAALLELQGVINDELLLVRSRFYAVLLNRQQIVVQEENVKLLTEQLDTAKSRNAAGASSNFEVLRAEVALANGNPPLIQARNDYRNSIEELRQAVGLASTLSGKSFEVVGTLEAGTREDIQLIEALSTARSSRPELLRLAKLGDASEQSLKAAHAGFKPQVDLVGRYDWIMGVPSGWSDRKDGWTASLQGQWNIFDGRSTAGKVIQSKSLVAQAKMRLEESTLAVDVEVRKALSSLQEAWEMVDATGKVIAQAEEALRLVNVRYSAGAATQLDVLSTQVALTESRLNQIRAFYSCNMAQASFRKALGKAESFVTK